MTSGLGYHKKVDSAGNLSFERRRRDQPREGDGAIRPDPIILVPNHQQYGPASQFLRLIDEGQWLDQRMKCRPLELPEYIEFGHRSERRHATTRRESLAAKCKARKPPRNVPQIATLSASV